MALRLQEVPNTGGFDLDVEKSLRRYQSSAARKNLLTISVSPVYCTSSVARAQSRLCRLFAPRFEDALPQPLESEFGVFLRRERKRDAHERRDARIRQKADARDGEDALLERGRRDEGGGVAWSAAILRQLQIQEELRATIS